ncbi:MAG TPA: glutathione S-transferase N-terminal domain-containing protein [Myxococcota bacterium]|nr:glutathione S-transferase N-terminal domain-containing protein [Myxococcota bacterium]
MFTLYLAPNTCALASLIALEEAGAPYRIARVDFAKTAQRAPEYLALNPKGRVPALVTDEGILTETPAILAYVAQMFPEGQLAPLASLFDFARAQAFNSYLCSTVHVAHAHRMRGHRWVDPTDAHAIAAMQRKVPQSVGAAFALIEDGMLEGPWVLGERYSICDGYLFTLAQWLEADGVDLARLPRVLDHRRRVAERPAVKRALAAEQGGAR